MFALFYLDDTILFSKAIDDHKTHLKAVITLFKDGDLTLKLQKCFVLQDHVEYLGHIVTTECQKGKLLLITAYHPKPNGNKQRYNRSMAADFVITHRITRLTGIYTYNYCLTPTIREFIRRQAQPRFHCR